MKVVYTEEALRNLDDILAYIASHYPTIATSFEIRVRTIVTRLGAWPESAQEIAERPGVRVVPLIRYPYKVFYRVSGEAVEILHIHHAARQQSWEDER